MPRPLLTDKVMPFGDHLEELRRRIIWALAGLVPILIGALFVGRPLLRILAAPMKRALNNASAGGGFMATGLFETFNTYLKLSIILTLIIGAPWILYQLWLFISPGLYANERRFAHLLAPLSLALTIAGIVFMYFAMLPMVLAFFVGFSASLPMPTPRTQDLPPGVVLPSIPTLVADPPSPTPGQMWVNRTLGQLRVAVPVKEPDSPKSAADKPTPKSPTVAVMSVPLTGNSLIVQQLKISEYLSTVMGFALAFALGFQTPVVVLLLGWAGLVTPSSLSKYRKYAIFGCAVVAAILTPADFFSMFVLAVPLYLLYELGVLLLRVLPASKVAEGRLFGRAKPAPSSDDPTAGPDDR